MAMTRREAGRARWAARTNAVQRCGRVAPRRRTVSRFITEGGISSPPLRTRAPIRTPRNDVRPLKWRHAVRREGGMRDRRGAHPSLEFRGADSELLHNVRAVGGHLIRRHERLPQNI